MRKILITAAAAVSALAVAAPAAAQWGPAPAPGYGYGYNNNYGQVRSLYGSGEFKRKLDDAIDHEALITADIKNKEEIYDAIKVFLGKGK